MGQQQYAGMVQQMLSPSIGQLGLSGTLSPYAKHNLGLGSLSGPGSPSVGGSSTPASMSASTSGSASASGSRPSLPTSVSASLTGASGSGMLDDDGARRSPMPLSFAYQLHAQGLGQGQGQTQDMTQSRNLFVGNVSLLVSNSRLYPMSVYIAYIRILSRFYPFILFPFLVLGSCTDHLSSYPTAPFSHPMARPQRSLQASGHHPPRGRRSRTG